MTSNSASLQHTGEQQQNACAKVEGRVTGYVPVAILLSPAITPPPVDVSSSTPSVM
jgi:hypothetical protein